MTESPAFLSPVVHRVVQADRRRFSIKLEERYWRLLEGEAGRRGVGLGRLIRAVAEETAGAASLAAALRLFCVELLAARAGAPPAPARGGAPAAPAAPAEGGAVARLVAANPVPHLVLAASGEVLDANPAFERWSGFKRKGLVGKRYDWFFQLRLAVPLGEALAALAAGAAPSVAARISYVAPGRIVVARARLCALGAAGAHKPPWAVIVESLPGAARAAAGPAGEGAPGPGSAPPA